jgi:hypothetical protein
MKNIEQIERNARRIKAIIASIITLSVFIYGVCIFIYQTNECSQDIKNIKSEMLAGQLKNSEKHRQIEERVAQNEKNFQMTSAKLDVSLIEIRSDLKFIKEHLMRKGLDH